MLKLCKTHARGTAAVLLVLGAATTVQAAPQKIEQFDVQSWQRFQAELPRPSTVVFSTTDCTHCPAAIAAVAQQLRKNKRQIPLIVVVMDGDQHPKLLQDVHYRQASRLFVLKGQTPALQYSVNPKWRGITPYVALFPKNGAATLITGTPSQHEFEQWIAAEEKP